MNNPYPPTPEYDDPLEWITAYLVIHKMSTDSYRYTFYLWYIVAAFFVLFSLLRLIPTHSISLGARWNKWSRRRRTWRGRLSLHLSQSKGSAGHPHPLPTNGKILAFAILCLVCVFLCFVGPDYIWHPNSAPTVTSRRAYDVAQYVPLRPNYTISKAWWTVGGRTGLIAFALFPLCVLFILKTPPFAIFALPLTARFYYDQLSFLHRWTAWLIWAITALHVLFWSIQLAKDKRTGTSTVAYTYAWHYTKFIYGWIAFGLLTLIMIASTRPLRRHYYELFYFLHIVLVPLTLIMSALHHPPVWYWCWAAIALWGGERLWRGIWWLYINGQLGGMSAASAPAAPGSKKPGQKSDQRYCPPPGYARVELMSGATLRLTYVSPGYISWAPGQSFLISIPSVSKLTSHPFTVASVYDEQESWDYGRAMVFYIRAKEGWTNYLWDHVTELLSRGLSYDPMEDPPNSDDVPQNSVLLRMWVEGPHGSAVTTDWKRHSSVVIIAGGVGVSYGAAVLRYLCQCMTGRDGKYLGGQSGGLGQKGFMIQRIRFVWILREFAHIQWCATILRGCLSMVPPYSLQIDIFVTNFSLPAVQLDITPPTPSSDIEDDLDMEHGTRLSRPNRTSNWTGRSHTRQSSLGGTLGDIKNWSYYSEYTERGESSMDNTLNLTNFDGDREISLYGEHTLNLRVLKAGKHKRESTRKSMLTVQTRAHNSVAYSVGRPEPTASTPYGRSGGVSMRPPYKRQDTEQLMATAINSVPSKDSGHSSSHPSRVTPERKDSKRSAFTFVGPQSEPAVPSSIIQKSWYQRQRPTVRTGMLSFGKRPLTPPAISPAPSLTSSWEESGVDDSTPAIVASGSNGVQVRIELSRRELQDVSVVSEYARPGKPKLEKILADEASQCQGSLLVTCCGPTSLDAKVREAISNLIEPGGIPIDLVSEDFSY